MNAALEKLCDHQHPEIDPVIKKVKDMAAAGVLIASIAALICGLLIFLPYFRQ
jgi:diacylglycerol kinase